MARNAASAARPEENRETHQGRDRDGGDHHRGFKAPALPRDHHVARTVGEPHGDEREDNDEDEEQSYADHRGGTFNTLDGNWVPVFRAECDWIT